MGRVIECWSALLEMFAEKKVQPTIYNKQYKGLESLAEALQDLSQRKTWGKAVVRVRDE